MDLTKVGTDRAQNTQVSEQSAAQKSQANKETSNESKAQSNVQVAQKNAVKWSADSQLLNEGLQAAKNTPENIGNARAEKVAQIKAAIQGGTYKMDAKKIADRMISSALEDDLATRNG